jgi:hypothetical protein
MSLHAVTDLPLFCLIVVVRRTKQRNYRVKKQHFRAWSGVYRCDIVFLLGLAVLKERILKVILVTPRTSRQCVCTVPRFEDIDSSRIGLGLGLGQELGLGLGQEQKLGLGQKQELGLGQGQKQHRP